MLVIRFLLIIVLTGIGFQTWGQIDTCIICPSGSSKTITSAYTGAHSWSCTNGSTSTANSITLSPTVNTTCILTVDDGLCIKQDTTFLNVCNCNNEPCINMSYNQTTDCITFQNTGTVNSPISTDSRQYLREFSSTWTNIPGSNELCGCDVRAKISVTPTCAFVSSNFRLGYNATICAGTTMSGWNWVPNQGSTISSSSTATTEWVTLSPTALVNGGNGGVLTAINRVSTSPLIYNFAKIRFVYTGSGTTCASITSTVLEEGTYYYDFTARRITTFTDGCSPDTCLISLNLPLGDPCQVDGYIQSSNFSSSDCAAPSSGLVFTVFNMTSPVTYQWRLNGSNISPNPPSFTFGYCLTGQAYGEYSVLATDANGCVASGVVIHQLVCAANVSITASGTTLTANATGCTGTATYLWQRWNGSTWVNVGTNSSTYNTSGLSGDYKVLLSCTGPPVCSSQAVFTFINPCNVNLSLSSSTTQLTASITGCGGLNITYTWQRWNGSSWVTVSTVNTTSTSNTYTPTLSGLYRVNTLCNSCDATAQISFTLPDPCTNFSAFITGFFGTLCNGSSYIYNRNINSGTSPFSTTWRLNGSIVGTGTSYTFTPSSTGFYTISVTVTDNSGCSYTDTRSLSVVNCCSLTTSISPASNTICSNTSQTFTRNASGGTAPYSTTWTYSLNGGFSVFMGTGSSVTQNFTATGTYIIMAVTTDATNCQSSSTATITVTSCTSCNCAADMIVGTNCQLIITVNGADCSGYSYQLQYSATGTGWSIAQSGNLSNFTYTPTQNGFYRLLSSKSGCNLIEVTRQVSCVSVACTNPPIISLASTSSSQCGLGTITINGTQGGSSTVVSSVGVTGGSGSINLINNTSANWSFQYTPSTYGTHVITFTTNNPLGSPCTPSTISYSLTTLTNPNPVITSSGTPMCIGQNRTLTGTPFGGTWTSSGAGGTVSGNTLTATTEGTVTVNYLFNQGGCSASTNQTITVNASPVTPVVNVDCTAGFGNAVLTVSSPVGAGLEYRLNSGTWQSSTTFSTITNGSYTVSVRNAAGCTNQTTVNVNCGCANPPTVTLNTASTSICYPLPVTFTGSFGGSATQVSITHNGLGTLNANVFNSSPYSITYTPGLYDYNGAPITFTVTTNNPLGAPCQAQTATFILTALSAPVVVISGNIELCAGMSTTLTASGASTYSWCCGLGTGASKTVNPVSSQTYSVTGTSSNGCTGVGSSTVTVSAYPTPAITSPNTLMCIGENRTVTGTPAGGSWSVSGAGTLNGTLLTANSAGTITLNYTVTSNTCTSSASQTITVSSNPPTSMTHTTSCSAGVGTITITSPLGAYEYSIFTGGSWSSYQSSTVFANLANGVYNVRVKNTGNACFTTIVNAITVSCSTCGCTPSPTISQSSCTVTLSSNCISSGYTHVWQESSTNSGPWTNLSTNTNSVTGSHLKYYRVVFSKVSCLDIITNVVQASCECQGFTLNASEVSGVEPNITFGNLLYNGSPVTNYRIEWLRLVAPSPVLTITSGSGTGLGTGIYAHPINNYIPVEAGNYRVNIVSSDYGVHSNCFLFSRNNSLCSVSGQLVRHNGISGSLAAVQTWSKEVTASTQYITISEWNSGVSNTETFEVLYNNVVVYSTSINKKGIIIPITYVNGVNKAIYRVTNTNTNVASQWFIDNINCCNDIPPCTTDPIEYVPQSVICTNTANGYQIIFKGYKLFCNPGYLEDLTFNLPNTTNSFDFNHESIFNPFYCYEAFPGNLTRFRLTFRNNSCKCQSWQLHADLDNNGSYETLITQAVGWTGSC